MKKGASQREAEILYILRQKEMYGLQIKDEFERTTGKTLPLGSLYVVLERMDAAGFLRHRETLETSPSGGNHRNYYRITAAGIRALDAYAADAQARVRFFGGAGSPA